MLDNKGILAPNAKQIDEAKQGEVFSSDMKKQGGKSFYIESYGCAMNFSDSEIVASILSKDGYSSTTEIESSDLMLINTCSIREKAEDKVRKRLRIFDKVKRSNPDILIGVLGCMAERLKTKFLEEDCRGLFDENASDIEMEVALPVMSSLFRMVPQPVVVIDNLLKESNNSLEQRQCTNFHLY